MSHASIDTYSHDVDRDTSHMYSNTTVQQHTVWLRYNTTRLSRIPLRPTASFRGASIFIEHRHTFNR